MCEVVEIRYQHFMEHPDYAGTLACGCVCAENMAEGYDGHESEKALRNAAGRRSRWLRRQWRTSAKGNDYLNVDGWNIVIFRRADGTWGGRFKRVDDDDDGAAFLRGRYPTEDAAKLAAFDALVFGRRL
jgi:hypothetical protein